MGNYLATGCKAVDCSSNDDGSSCTVQNKDGRGIVTFRCVNGHWDHVGIALAILNGYKYIHKNLMCAIVYYFFISL